MIILQAGVSGLDLSGSETMSTDSQITGLLINWCIYYLINVNYLPGCSSHSSSDTSRRLSNNDSGKKRQDIW